MLLIVGVLLSALAMSAERLCELDIPASTADVALKMLARQAGYQVIFESEVASSARTAAIAGRMTISQALAQLLERSNLTWGLTKDDVIIITRTTNKQLDEGEASVRKKSRRSSFWGRVAGALTGAFAVSVATQTQGQETMLLEEVTVTATKREQSLREIPFSMQALDGERLEKGGIRDLSELITQVPGASEVISYTVGRRSFQIRGTGGTPGDSTTGYYVDDSAFFLPSYESSPMGRSFDMERVEVLRGPQSTLYGNSSMGGTIRYITNKPDPKTMRRTCAPAIQARKVGNPAGSVMPH